VLTLRENATRSPGRPGRCHRHRR